jgi:hypothetical protein
MDVSGSGALSPSPPSPLSDQCQMWRKAVAENARGCCRKATFAKKATSDVFSLARKEKGPAVACRPLRQVTRTAGQFLPPKLYFAPA